MRNQLQPKLYMILSLRCSDNHQPTHHTGHFMLSSQSGSARSDIPPNEALSLFVIGRIALL